MVTPEELEAATSKLKLRVLKYVSKLADIVDGDDDYSQQELALEFREEVDKALEDADELRARMAQAKEDRDAYEF